MEGVTADVRADKEIVPVGKLKLSDFDLKEVPKNDITIQNTSDMVMFKDKLGQPVYHMGNKYCRLEPKEGENRYEQATLKKVWSGQEKISEVVQMQDKKMGRLIAAKKIVKPDLISQRTVDEAIRLARFNNPHIVTVHDLAVDSSGPDQKAYMVMEWVDGKDMTNLGFELQNTGKQAEVLRQVAEGLAYVHNQNHAWGDVKPQNIIMNSEGVVKLIDGGGVRKLDGSGTAEISEHTDYFSAPELSMHQVCRASDVYSFGMVAGYLMSGGSVVEKETWLTNLSPQWRQIFGSRPDLQKKLKLFLDSCTAKKIKDRPKTITEAAGKLLGIFHEAGVDPVNLGSPKLV